MVLAIQLISLFLTVESAIFFGKSNLGLSAKAIAELSTPKWNSNFDVMRNLAQQNADSWVGLVLLLASIVLQMIAMIVPGSVIKFSIYCTLLVSIIVSAIVFWVSWMVSKKRAKAVSLETERILTK